MVGLEGLFGFTILCILLVIMYVRATSAALVLVARRRPRDMSAARTTSHLDRYYVPAPDFLCSTGADCTHFEVSSLLTWEASAL